MINNNNNFEHLLNKFLIKKGLRKISNDVFYKNMYLNYLDSIILVDSFNVRKSFIFKNTLNVSINIGGCYMCGNYNKSFNTIESINKKLSLKTS